MEPELKQQLDEIHELVKDNHKMLRAIRRSQHIDFVIKIVIWIIVLALPLYLYQAYLAPTISKISELSGTSTTTTAGLFGLPSSADVEKMVNSINRQ